MKLRVTILFFLAASCPAQTIQVGGGDSSLFNAQGGSLKLYMPTSLAELDGGIFNGHVLGGFSDTTQWRGMALKAGDQLIPFNLPTDFSPNYFFYGRGVSIERKREPNCTAKVASRGPFGFTGCTHRYRLMVFVGETSTNFTVPFLTVARNGSGAGALFYELELSPHWKFASHEVTGVKQTAIQSIEFAPRQDMSFDVSGGVGSNSAYGAALLNFTQKWLRLKSGYALADSNFRRVVAPNLFITENRGWNGQADLTPWRSVRFSGTHENLLAPLSNGGSQSAIVNSATASFSAGLFDAHGGWFEGKSLGRISNGQNAGAGVRLWGDVLQVRSDIFRSAAMSTVTSSISERMGRHLRLAQFVTQNQGRTSVSYGGEFRSNPVMAAVTYQTLFLPFQTRSPFQQVINVQLSVHLPHNSSANVQTNADPTGRVRYTVAGDSYFYGNSSFADAGPRTIGKYEIRGTVVDETGSPVAGAVVRVGKMVLITDERGEFQLRMKKRHNMSLTVLPDEFQLGKWTVVDAPSAIVESPVRIVVRRVQ